MIKVEGGAPLEAGRCKIIAEAGANHNNSVDSAIEMAARAKDSGAWAVKFQMYKSASLVAPSAPVYWDDKFGARTQRDAFLKSDKLDYNEYIDVFQASRDLGIIGFATPFDLDAVEVMAAAAAPLYKIASGDVTYRDLIVATAQTGKPVILSTGASTMEEITRAIEWSGLGPERLILLACTLTYPTPDPDANYARITTLANELSPYLIGFSDHTLGVDGTWVAASLGAVVIEKHYTLEKTAPDIPDHAMSVEPGELRQMVAIAERAALLRGSAELVVAESELPARQNARRSAATTHELSAGAVLTPRDLTALRPGTGIEPHRLGELIGRTLVRDMPAGSILSWSDLAEV